MNCKREHHMEVNDQECAISSKMEQDPCVWVGVCVHMWKFPYHRRCFEGIKKMITSEMGAMA